VPRVYQADGEANVEVGRRTVLAAEKLLQRSFPLFRSTFHFRIDLQPSVLVGRLGKGISIIAGLATLQEGRIIIIVEDRLCTEWQDGNDMIFALNKYTILQT